jgi:cyclopropane fatty-acyl-phospholipid synthase-like methyltransferase
MKPFSESCEQNKHAILEVLKQTFADAREVLEIGSGSGQHAVFFARELPHLSWQTSDVSAHHPGIQAWIDEADLSNILAPLALNVETDRWPERSFDAIFSANTVHIMGWPEVEKMFAGIQKVLKPGGCFCLYGPFNIDGQFSAASNAQFEAWLKSQDPKSGIRDQADLDRLAKNAGLLRIARYEMPADNAILGWQKHHD